MWRTGWLVGSIVVLVSCTTTPGDGRTATEVFAECLERNGVVAEGVEVTLDEDGTVASISAMITSEGDVAYEPTVRLACTEEVEAAR